MRQIKKHTDINAISPIFRDYSAAYYYSEKNSYEEHEIITNMVRTYKTVFAYGDNEICVQYLDLFFRTLAQRGNVNHIKMISEMFDAADKIIKSKNKIYHRFLVNLVKNFNKK